MIRVRCRTNIDAYRAEVWPTEFCCRPLKGDIVASANHRQLRIVDITHVTGREDMLDRDCASQSYLIIELHN